MNFHVPAVFKGASLEGSNKIRYLRYKDTRTAARKHRRYNYLVNMIYCK